MASKDLDRDRNDDLDRNQNKVFGDIDPDPSTRDHMSGGSGGGDEGDTQSMQGGSQSNPREPAGARHVTGGTGGVGAETGGTRNFRQGTGASGGDVGNRPE